MDSETALAIREKFAIPSSALHVTRIENLEGIFSAGKIFSKNSLGARPFLDVSSAHVQLLRSKLISTTGKVLHDYVPFYLSFKTPMLSAIRDQNEDLVYIRICLDVFERYPGTILSDGNAASSETV